jgi:hypothetical protein
MSLVAKRLTAQQGVVLLRLFYDAWGPPRMQASYGWKQIPRTLMRGERMYAFYVGGDCVGWGSLTLNTRDADDEEGSLSVGVFPVHTCKGHRVAILDWLSARAAKLGAERVHQLVLKTNEGHYERTRREAESEDNPWVYAGDVWFPEPGYGYFVRMLREDPDHA